MGYTNHFYRVQEFEGTTYRAAVEDIKKILPRAGCDLAGWDGTGDPTFTYETIILNGRLPQSCEAFTIPRIHDGRLLADPKPGELPAFGYCKTHKLPYDVAVKVCLLIFKHHAGESIQIGSDDEDLAVAWQGAINLTREVLGYDDDWQTREWSVDGLTHRHLIRA